MSKRIRRRVVVNGQQVWVTASTEQEYAEHVALLLTGGSNQASVKKGHDFKVYAEKWFEVFSKPNVEKVTAITYERQLNNHLIPSFSGMTLEEITTADVQAMFNGIVGAKETKLKAKMVLNMIFTQALEDNIIQRNPLASKNIRISGRGAVETEPYTVDQMKYIASHLMDVRNPMDCLFLGLQAFHPFRLEEVLGLMFKDYFGTEIYVQRAVTHPDRNAPQIKETKTESSKRKIALIPAVASMIPKGNPNEFILGGESPMTYQRVKRMLTRIKKDIGFDENLSPRRFRTTVLTDIYEVTKDIKQAQAAAGHTTAAMTLKHYVKGRTQLKNTAEPISALYGIENNTM
ncbi:MAG: tyrosine-type recombinase/integrase family protein [Bacteroidaceae bacterium]|nr:tyrosine-type recombinase/integrase family protein [Clostridia bacterium]MBR7028086.1 tyrosine-type recombinase/integrase family protein [Bacteroidaceae bacterium]